MALIELSDVLNVGSALQKINSEIKTALVEVGHAPVGTVPREVAQALHNLQTEYNRARELYTLVYRTVYGEVPPGLGAPFLLLGAPLAAFGQVVLMVAAGGVLWQLLKALRDAIQVWRERQAGTLQQSKMQVLQDNLRQAQAAGDTAGAAFYREQLAKLAGQSPFAPDDLLAWVERNILWIAAGVLGFVLVTRR